MKTAQINQIEWKEVELRKVAKFINGRAFKPDEWENKGKIIIRIQDLTGSITNPNYTTQEFDKKYLVKRGDILISWSATLDAFIWDKEDGWLNQHIFKVEEDKKVLYQKYLFYFVKKSIDLFKKSTHGSTMKHITKGNFDSIKIPLPFLNGKPDLETQRKIVSILEKAEGLKSKGKKAEELLDEYLKSLFNEMFGKIPLKNFTKVEIEIIDGDRGVNYPNGNDFSEKGYCLFLNTGNVRKNGFKFEKLMYITKDKDEQLRKGKAQINDVILTTRGTVGNVGLYDKNIPYKHIRINSGMVLLRSNSELILPKFLMYLIQMPLIQNQFLKMNSGSAQPQLPIANLKKIKIPLPPIELQKKFASIVEKVERLKEKQRLENKNAGELFDSLMQKAFKGELVR